METLTRSANTLAFCSIWIKIKISIDLLFHCIGYRLLLLSREGLIFQTEFMFCLLKPLGHKEISL